MNRLSGKVEIVTGAALGSGHAIVRRMSEDGAEVVILDLLEAEGLSLETELGGRGVKFWRCDVSKEAEVEAAFGAAAR